MELLTRKQNYVHVFALKRNCFLLSHESQKSFGENGAQFKTQKKGNEKATK